MMKSIMFLFQSLSRMFSPSYIYTLDKSFLGENENTWIFKEFGTHTYIMKTWKQLQEGNFIRELNPKDILYIAQVEIRRQMKNKRLRICEEKRNGVYILSCDNFKISVTAEDFLKDYALVGRTEHHDIIKIAYYSGVRKGRLISSYTPETLASHTKKQEAIVNID